MLIGVPKEIKDNENRVGMIPSTVNALIKLGHQVLVEKRAGEGCAISDESYRQALISHDFWCF
jgi:alanine dehydrogenase